VQEIPPRYEELGLPSLLEDVRLDDPSFYSAQPYDVFAQLRADAPVHWYEPASFWVLSTHADVQFAAKNPQLFSSAGGVMIDEIAHPDRAAQRVGGEGEVLLRTDPPRHAELRAIAAPAFTQPAIRVLAERIRAIAAERLDRVAADGGVVDFVEAVSQPIPMEVVCLLLGLPIADATFLKERALAQTSGHGADDGEAFTAALERRRELEQYFDEHLEQRRRSPQDDLITVLAHAEPEGDPMSRMTRVLFCLDLLIAGTETTDVSISGGALLLAQHPDQRDRIAADLGRARNSVEEMLRYISPAVAMARTVTEEVTVRDTVMKPGDRVALLFMSANHDEAVWDEPDSFDIDRPNAIRHMAFGAGPHVCIGAGLARLELTIVLEELLARVPQLTLAGDPQPLQSTLVNGLATLPVRAA
jgi:cytochrome P450